MRIGMCCDMYLPYVSGVTNHIMLYKRYYESLGHEVFVFTFGNTSYKDTEKNVIRTPAVPWGDTGWNFAPAYSLEARKLMKSCDVLHAHHPFQSGRLAAITAGNHHIPLLFTNHSRYDLYSDAYAHLVPQGPRHATLKHYLKNFLDDCAAVIAPSKSVHSWLNNFIGCDHVVTVPNGIDIEFFSKPSYPITREELGLKEDEFVFLYMGRMAPEKNTNYLLDEFFEVAGVHDKARLLVVGGGSELEGARKRCLEHEFGERVVLLGSQDYERLPSYAALSDAFVISSVAEVHPLVVLEAMAAGLPVVAVASPGISSTVENRVSGLLAPSPTPSLLASEMLAIAKSPSLKERLAKGARLRIQNYTLENTAGTILGFYEKLIEQKLDTP